MRLTLKSARRLLAIASSAGFAACSSPPFTSAPSVGGASGDSSAGAGGDNGAGNAATSGGGTIASAGGHGGAASIGESAGSGGAPPCDGDCKGSTSVCDEPTNTCVECLSKVDCKSPKPACDTATKSCVECTATTDCKDASKLLCDQAAQQCVACLKQADCTSPSASACNGGACAACTKDEECSNIAGKSMCNAGTCVQCTGKKFAGCGQDSGTPLVCDSLKKTCTSTKQQSAGLCEACVSDAQCNPGQMCVLDKFGNPGKDVGYFCHWKQGAPSGGAPANCSLTGKPYSDRQLAVTSIDGSISDICMLRTSTCVANNQFAAKDCAIASAPNDAACGFAPTEDSKCVLYDSPSSTYRCTMTCLVADDCPGTTCKTGTSPRVCSFN